MSAEALAEVGITGMTVEARWLLASVGCGASGHSPSRTAARNNIWCISAEGKIKPLCPDDLVRGYRAIPISFVRADGENRRR
ncbi:hypothetical protein KCP73_19900 [Salmonella enterica subsp. enterica]|nr:hypothetical protein KCP73_19900 [Salmonella enterica subsp. enterica]